MDVSRRRVSSAREDTASGIRRGERERERAGTIGTYQIRMGNSHGPEAEGTLMPNNECIGCLFEVTGIINSLFPL